MTAVEGGSATVEEVLSYPAGYTPGQRHPLRVVRIFRRGVGPDQLRITDYDGTQHVGVRHVFDDGGVPPDPGDYFPLAAGYSWTFTVMDTGRSVTFRVGSADVRPIPRITANGATDIVRISPADALTITVALDPGTHRGAPADWWLAATTPFGAYWYGASGWVRSDSPVRGAAGAINVLAPLPVLSMQGLPRGTYTFYFGVDFIMNGVLDSEGDSTSSWGQVDVIVE